MSSDDCKSIESEPRCCEKCNPGIGKKSFSYLNNICPTTLIYTRNQCVFVQNGPEIILFWPLYQSVNLVYENLQIPVNSDGCTARKTCFWCLGWSDQGELCNSAASVPVQYLPDVTNHVTPGNIGSQDFQAKLFVTSYSAQSNHRMGRPRQRPGTSHQTTLPLPLRCHVWDFADVRP